MDFLTHEINYYGNGKQVFDKKNKRVKSIGLLGLINTETIRLSVKASKKKLFDIII